MERSRVVGEAGGGVVGQSAFAQYYPGFGWFGSLSTVASDTMYKIKKAKNAVLTITGAPTTLPKQISLEAGWNYVPCPHQQSKALIAGALPSITYTQEDLIKSQLTFATYYTGYGWFGQLSTLDPGQGYKMKLAAGGASTFAA